MANYRRLFLACCLGSLIACGSAKDGVDPGPMPDVDKHQKPVEDKNTLTLKGEPLQLTHVSQTWKLNSLTQVSGVENYLRLQKKFLFPIQFNGWVTLENIEQNYLKCARAGNQEPNFILEDDHNGIVFLKQGEKVPVSFEKLYVLRVEFSNDAVCKAVDIQFGMLYGTDD